MPENNREEKPCPACSEPILATAKKCKHCGEWLEGHRPEVEVRNVVTTERTSKSIKAAQLVGVLTLVVGFVLTQRYDNVCPFTHDPPGSDNGAGRFLDPVVDAQLSACPRRTALCSTFVQKRLKCTRSMTGRLTPGTAQLATQGRITERGRLEGQPRCQSDPKRRR